MAESTVHPNNRPVKFRGRPQRETPRTGKGLRVKAKKLARRGLISPKAMKTHVGGY